MLNFITKSWTALQKVYSPLGLALLQYFSAFYSAPPQLGCSLSSASVPGWLWDSWRTGDILEWKQQLSTSCLPLQRLEKTELLRRELVNLKSLVSLINKY